MCSPRTSTPPSRRSTATSSARWTADYQINKSIRDEVVFARHDVTSDPPFSQLDLVSCRNLLIYLGPAAQERVLPIIHYSLRPRGYLLLGASESIGSATDLFAPVDKKNKIYVKKPTTAKRLPTSLAYSTPFVHERRSHPGDGAHGELLIAERRFDPQRAAEDVLLTRFVPPSVVVTNEYEIIQFRGGDRRVPEAQQRARQPERARHGARRPRRRDPSGRREGPHGGRGRVAGGCALPREPGGPRGGPRGGAHQGARRRALLPHPLPTIGFPAARAGPQG